MTTTGKVLVAVAVAGSVGVAFYVVIQRRKAMLATVAAPAVPVGITSQYAIAQASTDYATTPVPAVTSILGMSLSSAFGGAGVPDSQLQAAQQQLAAQTTILTPTLVETRTGRGHF